MSALEDIPRPKFHNVSGGNWVRLDEVIGYQQEGGRIIIWLRHETEGMWCDCNSVQVKAFELALQR